MRLRLDHGNVETTVAEVRGLLTVRGRTVATWETWPSSTPGDLHERLLALGMTPYEEPVVAAMALLEPPAAGSSDVEVTRVASIDDYRRSLEIVAEAFGMDEADGPRCFGRLRARSETRSVRDDPILSSPGSTGIRSPTGLATYADGAVVVNAGSTLPSARGRVRIVR